MFGTHRSSVARRNALAISKSFAPYFELERRQLLAGITYDPVTGFVEIEGSAAADRAIVGQSGSTQLVVELVGVDIQTFLKSTVEAIRFRGLGGDDYFRNDSAHPTFAYGNAGDDELLGGVGVDRFQGGAGIDVLAGNAGNDVLRGNENDDSLRGDGGNDLVYGGSGDDHIFGYGGADRIYGEQGNDVLNGGVANDKVYGEQGLDTLVGDGGDDLLVGGDQDDEILGNSGNDLLQGGAGNDWMNCGDGNDTAHGQDGDDEILGGAGSDLLLGNAGNDTIRGGENNDTIYGQDANDRLFGDAGNDLLEGGTGNDEADGGAGFDDLRGKEGVDKLLGGAEADEIFGGPDADLLEGGGGDDQLFGDGGNDRLYGQSGSDDLNGGAGIDGLFGGIGAVDRLTGGAESDRFLHWSGHKITDYGSADGQFSLKNKNSSWTDLEVRIVDEGLHALHVRVGNSRIIRDSLDNDPVVFSKWSYLNGATSSNNLQSKTVNGVTTYDREIKFANWNENDSSKNAYMRYVAVHEIAHSWDSPQEINNRLPGKGGIWNTLLSKSGWTDSNPHDPAYQISGDGKWWYLKSAEFVREYSKYNPREDWATVWEIFFDPSKEADRVRVQTKVKVVSNFFDLL